MKPWQSAHRWHALFDNLIGAGTFFALALFWVTLSYRMMWFPLCHYTGRGSNACVNNLRQLSGAVDQYVIESGRTNGPVDRASIMLYLKKYPTCPSGGTYTYSDPHLDPACSVTSARPGVKERVGLFGWRWKEWPSGGPHKL